MVIRALGQAPRAAPTPAFGQGLCVPAVCTSHSPGLPSDPNLGQSHLGVLWGQNPGGSRFPEFRTLHLQQQVPSGREAACGARVQVRRWCCLVPLGSQRPPKRAMLCPY